MCLPRTLSLILFTIFALFLTTLAHADFQDGMDAYKRGDYETALKELRPLAEQGDAIAQYILGVLYDKGRGVPQDDVQARKWWLKAAKQNYALAQYNLGVLYDKGRGVPQDYVQAREWYRKAAEQGHAPAQYNLGLLYANGWGVPQDYVQAHMWVNLAATQGEENGVTARELIAEKMTPEQIAEAQRMVREWKPTTSQNE